MFELQRCSNADAARGLSDEDAAMVRCFDVGSPLGTEASIESEREEERQRLLEKALEWGGLIDAHHINMTYLSCC